MCSLSNWFLGQLLLYNFQSHSLWVERRTSKLVCHPRYHLVLCLRRGLCFLMRKQGDPAVILVIDPYELLSCWERTLLVIPLTSRIDMFSQLDHTGGNEVLVGRLRHSCLSQSCSFHWTTHWNQISWKELAKLILVDPDSLSCLCERGLSLGITYRFLLHQHR